MNRDDKAHRFVVTWNAFLDGNRLAYLALVLAIGVDALVFMAGLFGAAAVKSPLSDVPSFKARSAEQLQAVIDTALLPHTYENAQAVLNAMRPMAPDGGFTQRIAVRDDDPHARDLHRVLNAGATIGAVRHVADETYELRSELFEYISQVAKKAFAADKSHVALADLERIVAVALLPDVRDNVETVLKYVHPIEDRPTFLEKVGVKERHDFTAEIDLGEVDRSDKKVVRNALNAGASMEAVQRVNNSHYFISRDFYKTLARIRGRFLVSVAPEALLVTRQANERLLSSHANASTLTPLITGTPGTPRASIADNRGRLLANHHAQGNGSATRSDQDLEVLFRQELVRPIGVSAVSLDHIWDSEVAGEALAAANALKRQARQRPALNSELRLVESDSRRVLEQAQDVLAAQFQDDRHTLSLLHDVAVEIDRRIPALMLLPEGGLIDRLIFALEEASGDNRLSDDEHLLLSRLQKLKGDLEVMRLERLFRVERHRAAIRASQRAGPSTDPSAGPRPSPLGSALQNGTGPDVLNLLQANRAGKLPRAVFYVSDPAVLRLYSLNATTFCFCSPRPWMVRLIASPALSHTGGFMPSATPGGVPVVTTSPGSSTMNCEM